MLSYSDLIKRVLNSYVGHFKHVFMAVLFSLLWNIVIGILLVRLDALEQWIIPVLVVSAIISAYTELMLTATFASVIEGKPGNVLQIWSAGLKRLPIFFPLLILWGLLMFFGFFLFFFPAIIFATWFMFLSAAVMLEGKTWLAAFARSKALTSGFFFPLFLRAGVTIAVVIFIASAASRGFSYLMAYTYALMRLTPTSAAIIANAFGAVLGALLLPVITGTIVTLYYEMKKIKEA